MNLRVDIEALQVLVRLQLPRSQLFALSGHSAILAAQARNATLPRQGMEGMKMRTIPLGAGQNLENMGWTKTTEQRQESACWQSTWMYMVQIFKPYFPYISSPWPHPPLTMAGPTWDFASPPTRGSPRDATEKKSPAEKPTLIGWWTRGPWYGLIWTIMDHTSSKDHRFRTWNCGRLSYHVKGCPADRCWQKSWSSAANRQCKQETWANLWQALGSLGTMCFTNSYQESKCNYADLVRHVDWLKMKSPTTRFRWQFQTNQLIWV